MSSSPTDNIDLCLRGESLFGDDFDSARIEEWYAAEKEGYAELGAKDRESYQYIYHALNWAHGFRHVLGRNPKHILGFGSAYGDELRPMLRSAETVTIIDPSDAFEQRTLDGVPLTYIRPTAAGNLPIRDDAMDLVASFGVLHHIPNVSFVMSELARVTRPGGHLLIREPIVSMGDWRQPRRGLTRHERGIPVHILRNIVHQNGWIIERESLCDFALSQRLFSRIRRDVFNSKLLTAADYLLANMFSWNINYHPANLLDRLRPTSIFMVLRQEPA